jgi:tetratricopeptide (TPR) repeat protein
MDGRRRPGLWAAAFLAGSLAGCASLGAGQASKPGQVSLLPKAKPVMPEAGQSTVSRAMATANPKKNEPVKSSTFVALAQYREQLTSTPGLSFAETEQIRAGVRQAYQEALKADPKCTAAYVGLAQTYVGSEDAPKAYAMYEKASELTPNDPNLWYERALTHARFKDFDGALACLQKCVEIDPDNRNYLRTAGMVLARAGRADEALTTLRRCMKEEEARLTLARMCKHLGQPDQAREHVAQAIKAHPTYMPAHQLMTELGQYGGQNPVQQAGYQQPPGADAPKVSVGGIE